MRKHEKHFSVVVSFSPRRESLGLSMTINVPIVNLSNNCITELLCVLLVKAIQIVAKQQSDHNRHTTSNRLFEPSFREYKVCTRALPSSIHAVPNRLVGAQHTYCIAALLPQELRSLYIPYCTVSISVRKLLVEEVESSF